jgi:hypothetical protein
MIRAPRPLHAHLGHLMGQAQKILEERRTHSTLFFHQEKSFHDQGRTAAAAHGGKS